MTKSHLYGDSRTNKYDIILVKIYWEEVTNIKFKSSGNARKKTFFLVRCSLNMYAYMFHVVVYTGQSCTKAPLILRTSNCSTVIILDFFLLVRTCYPYQFFSLSCILSHLINDKHFNFVPQFVILFLVFHRDSFSASKVSSLTTSIETFCLETSSLNLWLQRLILKIPASKRFEI